jgi:hypothetical protein
MHARLESPYPDTSNSKAASDNDAIDDDSNPLKSVVEE